MFWKKQDPQWEKGIKHLRNYRKVNGDAKVSVMYQCSDGFKLGNWLNGQKRIGNRLPPDRLKSLRECGVEIT
jgi:hypothetical protein